MPRGCRSLRLSYSSACLPPCILPLRSASDPETSLRVTGRAQYQWFHCFKTSNGVRHHLLTNPGPPVYSKSPCLDPDKLSAAKEEFSAMEKARIIRRSSSPWSSPLHMVKKKDGGWKPCGHYCRLNNITIPDRYPLPNIVDFISRISGSTIFSQLDPQKGYYKIPMAAEDIPKTAIVTPFRMFEFLRLPFGLRNAWNTFQRMMDQILGNLTLILFISTISSCLVLTYPLMFRISEMSWTCAVPMA